MATLAATPKVYDAVQVQYQAAVDRYHERYDNEAYKAAVAGHTDCTRANFIINQALALCGDPYFKVELYEQYTPAEIIFLEKFV